jgi:hypothetical protein
MCTLVTKITTVSSVTKITGISRVFCCYLNCYSCAVYQFYQWLPHLLWLLIYQYSCGSLCYQFKVTEVNFLLWLSERQQCFALPSNCSLGHSVLVIKKDTSKPVHTTVVKSWKTLKKIAITFLIVVLPRMLTITQLLLQQNAHFYY